MDEKRNDRGRFLPGHPGGPGRPKGSKHKLEEAFLKALAEDFEANGVEAIKKAREASPDSYLRVITAILPKESKVDVEHTGAIEHRAVPEIGERVRSLFAGRADSDSSAILPH